MPEEPEITPVPPAPEDSPEITPQTEQIVTDFATEADFIEAGMFLLVEGQRLSRTAQVALLNDTEEVLGCSAYQMAKLLGMDKRGAAKPGKEHLLERRVDKLEEWKCQQFESLTGTPMGDTVERGGR